MAAGLGPADIAAPPDGLAHRLRHDGIVAGGKHKPGAGKLGPHLGLIPIGEPAEPLFEARDIERLRSGEGGGVAAAPKSLDGPVGIAAKPTAHAGNPRSGDVRTEVVESLDADQGAERDPALRSRPVQQPKHSEGMADSNGIVWPVRLGSSPTADE